jgi:sirohydrochlorin cobaltochelatase
MNAVIVLAHGSRDPLWRAPVEAVAEKIRDADTSVQVACAYLEMCGPDLPTAVEAAMAKGAARVRVLPLFFGMGKHAREDLPVLLQQLGQQHPGVRCECLPAAGEDPRLADLLAQIALEDKHA